MTQVEMSELLKVSDRTLRSWKKSRVALYGLLEQLDYDTASNLLDSKNNQNLMVLLENEKYFKDYRTFEKRLFRYLTSGIDPVRLKKVAKDTSYSKVVRARSAYLYTLLTNEFVEISFKLKDKMGLYHDSKYESGDGLAEMYGLLSGVNMSRFNQFKMKGAN